MALCSYEEIHEKYQPEHISLQVYRKFVSGVSYPTKMEYLRGKAAIGTISLDFLNIDFLHTFAD
jgi:hypothetical protein